MERDHEIFSLDASSHLAFYLLFSGIRIELIPFAEVRHACGCRSPALERVERVGLLLDYAARF